MAQLQEQVEAMRRASRQMVRELGFMDGAWGGQKLSPSACHAVGELDRRGALTISDLAAILRLDRSSASRLVGDLQQRGWVRTRAGANDKRRKLVELTKNGRTAVGRIDREANAKVSAALALLSTEERRAAVAGLDLYARALGRARVETEYTIRPVRAADDRAVARIIRTVMPEFGAVGEGYAIRDPEVSAMSKAYSNPKSAFFVVAKGREVLGCGGIAPLAGGDGKTCELRKMYFLPDLRGLGLGQKMLEACLAAARERGYRVCYLETLERMTTARALYAKNGFAPLCAPMGRTGHFKCDAWYSREL